MKRKSPVIPVSASLIKHQSCHQVETRQLANQFCSANQLHAFFMSSTFISNVRLKSAKHQANAKQHPETELLLFENVSHFSFTLSFRNNGTYPKNKQKNKYICIHEITRLIIMKMKKDHIDTTKIHLGQDMDTNTIINIRSVSVW